MKTKLLFSGLVGFLIIWGCAGTSPNMEINPDEVMVFPLPPDEPRIQFLRSYSSSSDIKQFRKLDTFLFGNSLLELETTIEKPFGIAIRDGKIYICDTMLPGLIIIDLKARTFKAFQPYGRGTLRKPVNLALDDHGNVYVADTERKQVVVFSPELKYRYALSSKSMKPLDLTIHGDSLLIADYVDRNVEIWSLKHRRLIGEFPPHNADLPDSIRIFVPYSVDVDRAGNIYISDFGQFRIQKFDKEGNFIRSFGGIGQTLGRFARPKGIAVDRDERLYVVDAAFENVQIFDREGNLLLFFGGAYQRPGNMYLPAQIIIDYEHTDYFEPYVLPGYELEFLILVTNQYGPDKIGIYGFIQPQDKTRKR
jgi:sugar lactone lactonase YvrE